MTILNLTQHRASNAQKNEGVIDLPERTRGELLKLLTFDEIPTKKVIEERARRIGKLAKQTINELNLNEVGFMVGGAPFLMPALTEELKKLGKPLFAFSKRVTKEEVMSDGSTKKISIFKHEGFIEV